MFQTVAQNVRDTACESRGIPLSRGPQAAYVRYPAMTRDTRNADIGLFTQPSMKKAPGNPVASVPRGFDLLGIQSLRPFSEPTPFRAGHPFRVPLGAGGRLGYGRGRHCHQNGFHHEVEPAIITLVTFLQSVSKVNLSSKFTGRIAGTDKGPCFGPAYRQRLFATPGGLSTRGHR
jgi:hypothetical protein